MDSNVKLIAQRIKGLRQILELTPEDMADAASVSVENYICCEEGNCDFTFTFLFKCANKFGVDITELISGNTPKLSHYSIVRKNKGLSVSRRAGFTYQHLGYLLKNRPAEPFKVIAPFSEKEQDKPITLSAHIGYEFDFVLSGKLKFQFEEHTEILNEGDAVFYDSAYRHGMIAVDNSDCEFLAVVFKNL